MISPWQWLFATLAGVLVAAAAVATTAKGRASSHPLSPLPPDFRLDERDPLQDRPVVGRRALILDGRWPIAAAAVEDTPLQVSLSDGVGLPGDGIGNLRRQLLPPGGLPDGGVDPLFALGKDASAGVERHP